MVPCEDVEYNNLQNRMLRQMSHKNYIYKEWIGYGLQSLQQQSSHDAP